MQAKAIREMNNEELLRRRTELKKDLVDFRLKMATGVIDNVRDHRQKRRIIARINTVLRERELAAASAAKQQ